MAGFIKVFGWARRAYLAFAALATLLMLAAGAGEPAIMTIFGVALPGASDVVEQSLVIIVFGGLAEAQAQKQHLVATGFLKFVPPLGLALLKMIGYLIGLTVFGLMCWLTIEPAWHSLMLRQATVSTLPVPMYPAKILLVLGCFMMSIQLLLELVQEIRELKAK